MAPPVAGYQAWYDAQTLTALADGTLMTSWSDLSGNGNNLTSVIGTPTFYKTTTAKLLNGHPTVFFNNDGSMSSASGPTAGQPYTIFVMCQTTTTSGAHGVMSSHAGNMAFSINAAWQLYAGSPLAGGTLDLNPHAVTGQYNGASSIIRVDGTSVASGAAGSQSLSGVLSVGVTVPSSATQPWSGPIGEIIVYPSALITADMQSVEAYLAARWAAGVTGTATIALGPLTLTATGTNITVVAGTATLLLGPLTLAATGVGLAATVLALGPLTLTALGSPSGVSGTPTIVTVADTPLTTVTLGDAP